MPSSDPEEWTYDIVEALRRHEDTRTSSSDPGVTRTAGESEGARGQSRPVLNLPRYEIRSRLGEGATAVVYHAWDRELRRPVAIKVLREHAALSDVARQRFRREAATAAGLTHPNLVQVHDAGESEGQLYIVMELVEGRPLSEVLKEGKNTRSDLAQILELAARGIGAAHEKGVVHRDLKPANIIVASGGAPKVGDFGLAHLLESSTELTRTGTALGTPLYMSPEQVEGRPKDITSRTDVYALGAILYEMLTGRPPHGGETLAELYRKIIHDDPAAARKLAPTVSRDFETIAQKAMEKDPSRRYPSAKEFAEDLRRARTGEPIEARPISGAERLWRKAVRYRSVLIPLAGAVAIGAGVGILAVRKTPVAKAPAFFERVEGDVRIVRNEKEVPAEQGQALAIGEEIKTGPWPSTGAVRFEDKTRVEIGPDTTLGEITASSQKHLFLRRGTILVRIPGGPGDPPISLGTPYAEARAAGATLRLDVDSGSIKGTRLGIEKGTGELRLPSGKSVRVQSNGSAVAWNDELSGSGPAPSKNRSRILLDDFGAGIKSWEFVPGSEFPGARGSFMPDPDVGHDAKGSGRLEGDFSAGGKYVAARFDVSPLPERDFQGVRLWAKTTTVAQFSVLFIDNSGQAHQRPFGAVLSRTPDWQEVILRTSQIQGGEHWGGANDGRWHPPMRAFSLIIAPGCFTTADALKGVLWIDDVEGILDPVDGAIRDPSFEQQTQTNGTPLIPPWSGEGPATIGVDVLSGQNGSKCGYIYYDGKVPGTWAAILQTVPVTPKLNYTLSGWVQTSTPFPGGAVGIRTVDGAEIARHTYGPLPEYAPVSVSFNSGSNSSVVIFAGLTLVSGQRGPWIHVDDWSLVREVLK